MPAPKVILDLVDRFTEHRDTYRDPSYNETQLRRDFLDPFFAALGWDVHNEQGYAEAYRDVIHEDSIRVEQSARAPDYCFRIGGARKFFVEAKKPAVDIKSDASPAFQVRRYAWTAKLPLSILTDFEEFAVYDCRFKPDKNDSASKARVLFMPYTEFAERWDEIASIFSPDAIRKGSFDKYAESNLRKSGTAAVDDAFLEEIEQWRLELARNIALRNPTITTKELNFAVQRIIDRIIFLRMCEGRAIERYGQLQALQNGKEVYKRLVELFHRADEKYNSGLFHFQKERGREEPDELTTRLSVDDKILKNIIARIYYPDSPYEFAALPADILGQVYEQFLGKVIRLTPGHQAKVEEKPEVRKAGGVYYTPTYIVDYIVEHTVGKLLEGKTPQQVGGLTQTWRPSKRGRPLSVLDPACGSGSFLIVAYQFLLDWYLKQYTEEDDPKKHARGLNPRVYNAGDNAWRLTTDERKRILLAHIYGVDIDYQAVEVTKLSLLLKVLEGETKESIERQLFSKQRALPDLANNIKCGNSLIGPDFYDGRQMDLFDEEELLRINAFDWEAAFPQIFKGTNSGFDAVIGNPPYVRMEEFKEIKEYLRSHYECHAERTDLYVYFIEREHALLRTGGEFGMIVSNKFIRAKYGQPVRKFLADNALIKNVVDLAGLPVFRGATVRTIILITEKGSGNGRRRMTYSPPPMVEKLRETALGTNSLAEIVRPGSFTVPLTELGAEGWRLLRPSHVALMTKLAKKGVRLVEASNGYVCMGIKSGLISAFVIDEERRENILSVNPEAEAIIQPFLQGRQIRPYCIDPIDAYLIYTHHGIDMTPYPAVIDHLAPFKKRLMNRATRQAWYELQQPQYAYYAFLREPKIVFPDIATDCRFALDTDGRFGANTVYFLPTANRTLLGLLNSRLALFFFQQTCAALEGPAESYLRFFGQYLENFPVILPSTGTNQHDRLTSLVDQMLALEHRVREVKTPQERSVIENQITTTDRQIDQLVYELYGLTDKEIALVEEATA